VYYTVPFMTTKAKLIEKLEQELQRERIVTSNQLLGISRHYSVADFDQLKALMEEKTAKGESLDLFMILSYNFTPNLGDRAVFSPYLDDLELSAGDVAEIVKTLVVKHLTATLGFASGPQKIKVELNEEVIARYVRNLRLDSGLADKLRKVIGELIPEKESPAAKAVFRDEVWQKAPWRDLAVQILYAVSRRQFRIEKLIFLTTFIAANHPRDMAGLVRLVAEVIESYETEIRRLDKGAKMFFNENIRESYEDSEADKRNKEESKLNEEKRQHAIASTLLEDLKTVNRE